MFCPQCRAEFRDGFDRCNECDLPLVESLPPIPEVGDEPLEAVFTTRDASFLPVLRSLLDARDIPYVSQGEESMSMLPLGTAGGIFGRTGIAARLLVPASRAEEARALLADTESELAADLPEELTADDED